MGIYRYEKSLNSSYAPMSESVSLKPSDFSDIVYGEGVYFKNCSNLVTEEMISECCGDRSLIEQSAILEGAKLDMCLKNFLKEGQDYKSLKKDLNDVIKANNISDESLRSNGRKLLHVCKRILQYTYDIANIAFPIAGAGQAGATINKLAKSGMVSTTGITVTVISSIIVFVINFIINRLLRLLVDTVEFKTVKEDAEDVIKELRSNAKKANDPKLAEKMESEADRLEASVIKYSKKSN